MILGELLSPSFLPAGLIRMDKGLFHLINGEWHSRLSDTVIPLTRIPSVWIPFYLFLLLFAVMNFRLKGWIWALFFIVTVMITDQVSSSFLKETFIRLRPCRDPEIAHQVRFLAGYCPMSSSFPSSHAVNHFGMATFIYFTFGKVLSKKWIFIFLWAALISYAQVYVGVHFPIDVFCGSIVGTILGYLTALAFNKTVGLNSGIKQLE